MSVRASLAWAFSGQIVNVFVQLAGSLVIARLLSPYELGVYAIAMAAIGLVQVFATFGIAAYIVREAELTTDIVSSAFTINALLAIGLSAVLTGISFAASALLGSEDAAPVLRLIAIANLFSIASFLPLAMLQREMQFKKLAFIGIVGTIIQTCGTIAFAWLGASSRSPAYASLCASFASAALAVVIGRQHAAFRLRIAGWRPITTFGLQIMSINGVGMLNGRLSDLLVGRLLGVTELGLYSRASSLSNMLWENIYGTAARVMFVQLSQAYRGGADWKATYLRSFAAILAFMWPILLGLAILARPAVNLLYGVRWLPAAAPLSALMLAQCVGVAYGMIWELFVLRGETGRQGRYETARLFLGLPIFAIGCLFSITAAGCAKIADALIGALLYYPHVRRLAGLGPGEIPAIYLSSGGIALCAIAPALVLMIVYDWSAAVPLPLVAAAVALGISLWLAAIMLTRHPLRNEWLALYAAYKAPRAQPRG